MADWDKEEVTESKLADWLRSVGLEADSSPSDLAFALSQTFEIYER